MRTLRQHLLDDQRGQLIAIAMAILGLGTAVVVPALAYVGSSMRSLDGSLGHAEEVYAAEAMIEAVVADMRRGIDVVDAAYVPPSLTLNGHTPAVSVYSAVLPFPRIRVFADPGTTTHMSPLAPGESFIHVVDGVQADADIELNWNYTPENPTGGPDTRIEIFQGYSTDTADRIRNNTDNNSPHQHTLGSGANDGGTFTFRFTNESDVPLTSAPFGDEGDPGLTWMSLVAGVDYIVTAEAGASVVQAYLQVGPGGAGPDERTVAILAWLEPQDYFSDLQNGGTTTGWVLDTGGLGVDVTDLPAPDGHRIDVVGGAGAARVVACGFIVLLDAGDSIDATCGSLTLAVLSGDIEVITDPRVTLSLPEGTQTTISRTDRHTTLVENFPTSPRTITATVVTPTRTGIVTVPAAATVEIVLPPEGGAYVRAGPTSVGVTGDRGDGPVPVLPGEVFVIETPLAPGLHGMKLAAIDTLTVHEDQSERIEDAIEHIEDSIVAALWESDLTLDPKRGKDVFKFEKRAVMELLKALAKDELGGNALADVQRVIDDLVLVDRSLAADALDLSRASALAHPNHAGKVERKQDDAQEQIDDGDDDLEDGRPDKAVDHYRRAWEYAIHARRFQVPPAGDIEEPDEPEEGQQEDVGVRAELYIVVQALQPIVGESDDVEKAVEHILQSLVSSYWTGASSLDPGDGDDVFERLEDAADDLQDVLDDDDLAETERAIVLQAVQDLVEQGRVLAYGQLQQSLGMPAFEDADDQEEVEDHQEEAVDDFDDGDEERGGGDWNKAIDAYGKAWEHATDALDEQGAFDSEGGPDEVGDGEPGLRGAIQQTIAGVDGYQGQSDHVANAIEKLEASLTGSWWSGHSTLDPGEGDDALDKLEDAIDEIDDAGEGDDDLSNSAKLALKEAVEDVVAIARALADGQLQHSLSQPELDDWHDQRAVERDQEDAMDELDDGDEEAEDGDYDKAVDYYRNAWEQATDALQAQGAP